MRASTRAFSWLKAVITATTTTLEGGGAFSVIYLTDYLLTALVRARMGGATLLLLSAALLATQAQAQRTSIKFISGPEVVTDLGR